MPYAYRTSDETRDAVLQVLLASKKPLTRKEISDAIGRTKGKQIVRVIEEFVAEGVVCRTMVTLFNRAEAYAYYVPVGQGNKS